MDFRFIIMHKNQSIIKAIKEELVTEVMQVSKVAL
jgi:hypothetical protein